MRTTLARLATTSLVVLIVDRLLAGAGDLAIAVRVGGTVIRIRPVVGAGRLLDAGGVTGTIERRRPAAVVHADRSRDVPGPWICPRPWDARPDGSGARREPARHDPDAGRIDLGDPRQRTERLARDGRSRSIGATPCGQLHPVSDGSVRVVCTLIALNGDMLSPTGVFAFDANGRLLPGWPIALDGSTLAARMVGDELTMFASWPLVDLDDGSRTTNTGS